MMIDIDYPRCIENNASASASGWSSFLVLVFDPMKTHKGSFLNFLHAGWCNRFSFPQSIFNLFRIFSLCTTTALIGGLGNRVWVVVPLISPWGPMRAVWFHYKLSRQKDKDRLNCLCVLFGSWENGSLFIDAEFCLLNQTCLRLSDRTFFPGKCKKVVHQNLSHKDTVFWFCFGGTFFYGSYQ